MGMHASWMAALGSACLISTAPAMTLPTADGPAPIRHWGYQLQGPASGGGLQADLLAMAPHDLLVMDFSRFGNAASQFSPAQVRALQQRQGAPHDTAGSSGRRVVAAYLSIGEAEQFRSLWQAAPGAWTRSGQADSPLSPTAPAWLGPVNPQWPESRKVRYWDAGWQALLFNPDRTGWLDQIVAQGFDAAYLDIVDAYYFWGHTVPAAQRRPGDPTDTQEAARRMIDFIVAMTAHARQVQPTFFMIPQNGAFLLNDADFAGPLPPDPVRRAAYLEAIGGIGVEDVYFPGDAAENNPFAPHRSTIAVLQRDFLAANKPVFAVDYVNDPAKIARFLAAARADGFLPYVATSRKLDRLTPPMPSP